MHPAKSVPHNNQIQVLVCLGFLTIILFKEPLFCQFEWLRFSWNHVSNGEVTPLVLKSMYGKETISANSGVNFLE